MLEEKAFFMFCDAHFHLVHSGLLMDIKSEFSSAGDNAVFYGCTCAHEREEYESQKKLAAEFSKELKNLRLFTSFGIHPQLPLTENASFLEELLRRGEIDAVGEAGFDLYTPEFKKTILEQEDAWRAQVELAAQYNKPLVVHCRKALHLIFRDSALLRKICAVVFHSFCGGMHEAEGILGKGINAYFSFGKQILNGNKKSIECVRFLPSERLLLETDAPFQTLKNENMTSPLEIRRVYQAALEIRRRENPLLSMDELQRALSCNFLRVFDRVEK